MAEICKRNVLLFDLDGTLVDSAPAIAQALSEISVRRGGNQFDIDQVRQLISSGVETLVSTTVGSAGTRLANDIADFRAVLRQLIAESTWLYPGVVSALAALSGTDFTLAVVTNKPEGMSRQLLQGLGIDRYFLAVVGGDTVATLKPDPAPVLHALHLLGSTARHAIFIGDSAADAAAAAALSIPFILHTGGYDPAGCAGFPVSGSFHKYTELSGLCMRLRTAF